MDLTKNHRLQLLIAVLTISVFAVLLGVANSSGMVAEKRFVSHIDGIQPEKGADATAQMRDDFTVTLDFTSHLPLIVIDTNGVEVPISHRWDYDKGYSVPIEDVDPLVYAKISIFDNSSGSNSFTNAPAYQSWANIKRRGNSSMSYEKAQWKINLLTESGQKNRLPLLGMDPDDDWVLSGTMIDKSLMRNYLAYTLAAEFMPYTPEVRYCEVFIKEGDTYEYQGVYLLTESIKQGEGRIEISDMKTNGVALSYIVRRDRWDPEGLMLDTYATREGLTYGYFGLLYPKNDDVTPEIIQYIENDLSAVESVLYSDNPSVFLTYPDYINVDSFVDYYLINEFLTNYDAGNNSTYLYKDFRGKLCIGPVWDYDGTIDNYANEALNVDVVNFHEAPWFDRLINDRNFIKKLNARYSELRRSTLNDDYVGGMIDDIAVYLHPAQIRDWTRWEHIYIGDNRYTLQPIDPFAVDERTGEGLTGLTGVIDPDENPDNFIIIRQTSNYNHELSKIKYLLRKHANVLQQELPGMRWHKDIIESSANTRLTSIAVLGFVVAFFCAVIVVRRQ